MINKINFGKLFLIIKIAPKLGIWNILNVIIYRITVKTGFQRACRITSHIPKTPFFELHDKDIVNDEILKLWDNEGILFSNHLFDLKDKKPDWFLNYLKNIELKDTNRPWWKISDFDEEIGDIKTVWELSRMDWALVFAQKSRNGNKKALSNLNNWIEDWLNKNPPYIGPNWKCGQEASIRVINLICCSKILSKEYKITPSLSNLLLMHLERIHPTISYSKAQMNNHFTSEACALFIGGAILYKNGYKEGYKFQKYGKIILEQAVSYLIKTDGSFSQYSLNYHRLMIDTLSIAEMVRKDLNLKKFKKIFYIRASSATNWLFQMVESSNGYAPNIGHNDGARLLQLTKSKYLDYRQSVHLSMNLFNNRLAYNSRGNWNHLLHWLNINESLNNPPKYTDLNAKDGGFFIKRLSDAKVVLRYPRFSFRPSQSDILHLDFWLNGKNVFRDGGTYSYNTSNDNMSYFFGTASHNTVQFDNRDQMPRISRFLFGEWIKSSCLEDSYQNGYKGQKISYKDSYGCFHERFISLNEKKLIIFDKFFGFNKFAILRWRLPYDEWHIRIEKKFALISNNQGKLKINSSEDAQIRLVDGFESKHYLSKSKVKVVELLVKKSAKIQTSFEW